MVTYGGGTPHKLRETPHMNTEEDLTLVEWLKVFAIAATALASGYLLFCVTTLVMMWVIA